MKYPWIDEYLLSMPGVTKNLQAEWNWVRYQIGDKMFAAVCLDDSSGKPVYITMKLDPAESEFLRQQYEDIILYEQNALELCQSGGECAG